MSSVGIHVHSNMITLGNGKRIATRSDLDGRLILEDKLTKQRSIQESPDVEGLIRLLVASGEGVTVETNRVLAFIAGVVERLGIKIDDADAKAVKKIGKMGKDLEDTRAERDALQEKLNLLSARCEELQAGQGEPLLLSAVVAENHAVWLAEADRSYSPHNKSWGKLSPEAKTQIAQTVRHAFRIAAVPFEDDLQLK